MILKISAKEYRDIWGITRYGGVAGVYTACEGKRICPDCPLILHPDYVVFCNGAPADKGRNIIDHYSMIVDDDVWESLDAATTEG